MFSRVNVGPTSPNRQMDGRYQTCYLPCFAVNNKHILVNANIILIHLKVPALPLSFPDDVPLIILFLPIPLFSSTNTSIYGNKGKN